MLQIRAIMIVVFLLASSSISTSYAGSTSIGSCTVDLDSASEEEVLAAVSCLKREYNTTNIIAKAILKYTIDFEKEVARLEGVHIRCMYAEQKVRSSQSMGYPVPYDVMSEYNTCQTTVPQKIESLGPIADKVKVLDEDSQKLQEHYDQLHGKLLLLKIKFGLN